MTLTRVLFAILTAGMVWLPAAAFAQEMVSRVTIHVVQRGETLYDIALDYEISLVELARLNGLIDPGNILVGQRLLVPLDSELGGANPRVHQVHPGESLQSIANFYGQDVQELATLNALVNPNSIFIGQLLQVTAGNASDVVSAPESSSLSASATVPLTNSLHTVSVGETLYGIATFYGLAVNDLARVNSISDPSQLFAGQQLIIPHESVSDVALDLPTYVSNIEISPTTFVEGQAGQIRLTTTEPATLHGFFLGRPLLMNSTENNTVHKTNVGVPVFTPGGVYPLELTLTGQNDQVATFAINVQILPGDYATELITVPEDKAELLNPAAETYELNLLQNLTGAYSTERFYVGPMSLPVAAAMNGPFGVRRSYNGGPADRFHTGADFAAGPGTTILAAASGRVVLADTLNIRGVTTVIDHGQGVFSVYSHQSERYVSLAEMVSIGQVIGAAGATGRVTGAHLHWEVWLHGVPVDPMQWIQQDFS